MPRDMVGLLAAALLLSVLSFVSKGIVSQECYAY
jgi:hypothetical protein